RVNAGIRQFVTRRSGSPERSQTSDPRTFPTRSNLVEAQTFHNRNVAKMQSLLSHPREESNLRDGATVQIGRVHWQPPNLSPSSPSTHLLSRFRDRRARFHHHIPAFRITF